MTRDSLRELEGGLVHFEGRVLDIHTNEPGARDFLLGNVTLRRWDGNSRVRKEGPVAAVVDHAWFRRPVGDTLELLMPVHGVARVSWYRRSDGTVDLGLQDIGGICVDDINAELNSIYNLRSVSDQLLKRLDEVIPMLTASGVTPWLFRVRGTSRGFVQNLCRCRENARAEIARRAARQAESANRRQRQSTAGFKGLLKDRKQPQSITPFISHDNTLTGFCAALPTGGCRTDAPGPQPGYGQVASPLESRRFTLAGSRAT